MQNVRTYVFVGIICLFSLTSCISALNANSTPTIEQFAPAVTQVPATTAVTLTETAVATPIPSSTNTGHIPPDDPNIRYTGRFDFSDPQRPSFDWPATTIEATFTGPSLTLLLTDNGNLYNVYIDDQFSILQTDSGQQSYPLAQNLSAGNHTVRLVKRTEPFEGSISTFLGFELEAGHGLTSLPPAPQRHIEIIGDSITAGYGNEGSSPTCNFSLSTQNAENTYGAMVARQLNASYTIIADSGLGVVRNYNANDRFSQGTMFTQFKRTLGARPSEDYAFDQQPDAVIINLGTNDFSTTPQPHSEVFLQGYTELIGFIRAHYPDTHIFAVGGPIMLDPAEATIQSAVEQMRRVLEDNRVHYVGIENNLVLTAVDYGCDWHPNVSGQQKIADQLTPTIAQTLNW